MNHPTRFDAICHLMEEYGADQLIISDPSTIFYLTGRWFSPGERLLVLLISRRGDTMLFNNELFPLPEDVGLPVVWYKDTDDYLSRLAGALDGEVIAVDKTWPARFLLPLMSLYPAARYIVASPIADGARLLKDPSEQVAMHAASNLNDSAMHLLAEEVTDGVTEKQLARRLMEIYAELGCDGPSFTPIVAFGANGADPHHETDDSVIQPGDTVIFDIGCKKDSYSSDMTRTYFFREVPEEASRVYEIVRQANERAIAQARPGNRFSDVDRAARDFITAQGYGPYFTHRTGHGIGIDVHEPEDVSGINDHLLKPGMIFSIEPGIYIPGKFGVRIEDLVLITEHGCEVLNEISKDLTVLPAAE
ncbi:Xaa-Pro peptidase family protein [Clostridiaceae bacterium HFYG-1003]|nr:Xaa-Pro peptidase family protein [Clostridiaceae bacterium HFYG-1003]